MGNIRLLPEDVANQVAAGEVVERPASVVKELVENSLDAGSRRIEVLIRRGGISQIKIVDDGMGMDRDDALLCLERHATSKIRNGHDLAAIATLGFRGEALPSIASVSRFRLSTRPREAEEGTEILISAGKIEAVRSSGDAPGTQIEVRSLFYNLPARRKFLRTENTEASHVEHQFQLQAIGHPDVAFTLLRDDRTIFQLPASAHLSDRLRDLLGSAVVDQLVEIPFFEHDGLRIKGFVGKPGISRSNRSQQITFVNGRAVENSAINHALREGYHTALMRGQYPITFLFLEIDPAAVDVNVHPAKREVRFRNPAQIREILADTIRRTLDSTRGGWERQLAPPPFASRIAADAFPRLPDRPSAPFRNDLQDDLVALPAGNIVAPPVQTNRLPNIAAPAIPQSAIRDPQSPSVPQFKILGVLGKLYLILESKDGLVLVDQHAAHERILFEQLQRSMESRGVASQRLLLPFTLSVTPRDHAWLSQNLGTLQRMGIGMETFGENTYKIDALPGFIKTSEPLQLVRQLIDDLRSATAHTSSLRLGEDVIAKTVCRHAVKANDVLHREEQVQLIQDLLACDLPYCCPHGRPTLIQFGYSELEKKFGRKS